jgi:hypothetical protein
MKGRPEGCPFTLETDLSILLKFAFADSNYHIDARMAEPKRKAELPTSTGNRQMTGRMALRY